MNLDKRITEKFNKLINEGKNTLANCGYDFREQQYNHYPSDVDYKRFRTESANLIKRVCGEGSHHYFEIKQLTENDSSANNSYYYKDCVGVIEAAANDFKDGFLFDIKTLVAADILDDFLEQSEVLFKHGYYIAAASLCGAVLEDSLRKLSEINEIPIPEITKIGQLNDNLAKAGVYTKLVQKKIIALADVRNNADHGHHNKFKKEDVEDMINYIRRFTTDYLS